MFHFIFLLGHNILVTEHMAGLCTLYHVLEDFESALPKPESFEGSGTEMPFVILGDEAYPLKTDLMKLFAREDLSCEERVFNYKL